MNANASSQNVKRGSVLIVGSGIGRHAGRAGSGPDSGYKVHLVEKDSAIGGTMSILDKTFPTGDVRHVYAVAQIGGGGSPRQRRHPHVVGGWCRVAGQPGDFTVTLRQQPRYVDPDKCTGCGLCEEKCPKKVISEYEQGLTKRKGHFQPVRPGGAQYPGHAMQTTASTCKRASAGPAKSFVRPRPSTSRIPAVNSPCKSVRWCSAPAWTATTPANARSWGSDAGPTWCRPYSSSVFYRLRGHTAAWCKGPATASIPTRLPGYNVWGPGMSTTQTPLVFLGMLHVRHQAGGDCQRARQPDRTEHLFSWKCVPLARISTNTWTAPSRNTACAICGPWFPWCGKNRRPGIWRSATPGKTGVLVDEIFDMVVLSIGFEPHRNMGAFADVFGIDLNPHRFAKTDGFRPRGNDPARCLRDRNFPGTQKTFRETVMQGSAVAGPHHGPSGGGPGNRNRNQGTAAGKRRRPGGAPHRGFCLPLRHQHFPDGGRQAGWLPKSKTCPMWLTLTMFCMPVPRTTRTASKSWWPKRG